MEDLMKRLALSQKDIESEREKRSAAEEINADLRTQIDLLRKDLSEETCKREVTTCKMADDGLKEEVRLLRQQVETLQARVRELESERREYLLQSRPTGQDTGNINIVGNTFPLITGFHGCSSAANVWTCPMCTYDNPVTSQHCDVCDEAKPLPAKQPMRQQDIVCDG